jgi:acyl dehydratase
MPAAPDASERGVAGTLFAGLAVGDRISTGGFVVTPALSLEFARLYDPQPMHLDEAAGRDSLFGELVSSGWQTMAITMRLVVDARLFGGAPLVGLALDQARFLRPVTPGDELRVETEILSMTPSRIRPDRGTVQVKVVTLNQKDMPVLEQQWTMLLLAR